MRALGAFAIFGLVTAMLPISQVASFSADACPSGANPWKIIDPVVMIGGVAFLVDAGGAVIGPVLHPGHVGHVFRGKKIAGYGQVNADNSVTNDDWAKLHNFNGGTP